MNNEICPCWRAGNFPTGREIRSVAAKWSTRYPPPAFAAVNEICAHYFLQASGGCSGGHVSVNPGTELEPHQRRRLMLSDYLS